MMWIDIGVIVLLTLRIALFRPALPQLVDPEDDVWLSDGKGEPQEYVSAGDAESDEQSPREP